MVTGWAVGGGGRDPRLKSGKGLSRSKEDSKKGAQSKGVDKLEGFNRQ